MAERIVSPGVFTRENDLSFLAQGVGEIGAAFIGPFKQGPAFIPTIVRTQSEFEDIFGTPDGTYYTEYAVQNYLREAGTATIVRVGGVGGYQQVAPYGVLASGSFGYKLVAVLFNTGSSQQDQGFSGATLTQGSPVGGFSSSLFTVSGGTFGNTYSVDAVPTSNVDVADVFGESPTGNKPAYAYAYFENTAQTLSGSNNYILSGQVLPMQDFVQNATYASTPWVISQTISQQVNNLFRFHTIGDGTLYNTKYKIGISGVKAAGEDGSTDYSVFTVTIRAYSDTDKRKTVLETYNNVNLDPNSPNFIARRIGDRHLTIDSNGKITENGDYSNKSKYVRVEVAPAGTYPISSVPFGHEAYYPSVDTGGGSGSLMVFNTLNYRTQSLSNTSSNPLNFSGLDLESTSYKIDNGHLLKPIPQTVQFKLNQNFSFDNAPFTFEATGSSAVAMAKRQFLLFFQGGFDGQNPSFKPAYGVDIAPGNTQGFNLASSVTSGSVAYAKAINAVSNPDEWDINMVVTPGVNYQDHPSVVQSTIDMVEARQDAFYIADFSNANATIQEAVDAAGAVDSNYVGTYYPWVKTIDSNTNKLMTVPPSTLLPAVFAANDRLAAEWFAPAGLNRGGITGAVSVLNRLTHSERDTLYEAKVNPIAVFPGQGIVAYGQKTLQDRS